MSATYEWWLTDDKGVRITDQYNKTILTPLWFIASRVVNGIGNLQLGLPVTFDENLLKPDRMVQCWRAPSGGRLSLWRVYFVRGWTFEHSTGGVEMLTIRGPDSNDLLRRRIVAHYAGETEATATAEEADDLMKRIVTDAIADGTNPAPDEGTRVWGDFSVQGDLTKGPQLTKDFSWDTLLTRSGRGILGQLAQAAREAGTEVFFDVVPNTVSTSSVTFQFRTYTGQPGRDVSDSVTFSQEEGNLMQPRLTYDYSREINYVYAGGGGQQDQRNIQQVADSDRYNASQWNRCEGFQDARSQKTDNAVREAGRAKLEEGRPRRKFTGRAIDTKGTRFGTDWNFGDFVGTKYRSIEFDSIVRAVVISMDEDGDETIDARLEYEG